MGLISFVFSTPCASLPTLTVRQKVVETNLNPLLTSPDLRGRQREKTGSGWRETGSGRGEAGSGLTCVRFRSSPPKIDAVAKSQEYGSSTPSYTSPGLGGGKETSVSVASSRPSLGEIQRGLEWFRLVLRSLFATASKIDEPSKSERKRSQPPPNLPRSSGEEKEKAPRFVCLPQRLGEIQRGLKALLPPRRLVTAPSKIGEDTEGVDHRRRTTIFEWKSSQRHENGATLIEVIVMITMLTLLVGMVALRSDLGSSQAAGTAALLEAHLLQTKQMAMASRQYVGIRFDIPNKRYTGISVQRSDSQADPFAGNPVQVDMDVDSLSTDLEGNVILFDWYGRPRSGSGLLSGRHTITLQVGSDSESLTIEPTTGFVH